MQQNTRQNTRRSALIAVTALAAGVGCLAILPALGDSSPVQPHAHEGFTEPIRTIDVAAAESGRLAKVTVKRGDVVQANTSLMELDSSVLQATRRIAAARAGQNTKIRALEIEYDLAVDRYEKLQDLLDTGAGNPEEVRRAKADAAVAKLNIDAANEQQLLQGLELEEIDARLELRRIRTPIAGVVTEVLKDVGEHIGMGDLHVATVVDLAQLRVSFFVPTRTTDGLRPGQQVTVNFPNQGTSVLATVDHIGAVTQADSGRVRLDVLLDNPKGQFRSGVRCQLEL